MKPQGSQYTKIDKKVYVSFILIILLMISSEVIRQSLLSEHLNYSTVINIAGKQRMLSQRIAKNISLKAPFKTIKKDYDLLKEKHQLLSSGVEIPSLFTNEIKNDYSNLEEDLNKINVFIGCLKENKCQSIASQRAGIINLDQFTKKMDFIVNKSTQYIKSATQGLRRTELFIFIFIFIVIVLKLFKIIFPMQLTLLKSINSYEKSKEINKKLERAASIGTWELDIATNSTIWSDEVFNIHGLEKGQSIDKIDAIAFYKIKEQARILDYINDAISNANGFNDVFEFVDANGNEKWVQSIGEALTDENGEVNKLIGIFQDVTKSKNQELKIQQSSEISKIAIEGAQIGIWNWNMIEDTVECDAIWCKLYNIKYEDIKKDINSWREKMHPMDIKKSYDNFKKYMRGETKKFENIHRTKDKNGNWKHILSRGKFTDFQEDGKPRSFIGTCQDVTNSIKSQNEQKLILSSLNLGIWKWSIPNDDLKWDESLYALYGYSKEDFTGAYEAWEVTLRDDYKEITTRELQDSLKGIKDFDTTFPIKTKSGEEKYIGARAVIERDQNGAPIYMYGINWDKTDEVIALKKLENQRKQAEQSAKLANIGEMAAGVGHEINNPLLIIKGYTEILSKEYKSDSFDKILNATNRIEQIVSGLRQFVRLTDNDNAQINLNNLLQTTYDTMVELYLKENIKLELHLNTNAIILGNFGRVQQVIVNLITNAKDAVKDVSNPLIQIILSEEQSEFQIEVKDNGHGISKEVQKRIFDPFFTTKEVNKGTGIGLSLAHSIIKDHKGEISLTSDSTGTIFKVCFPKDTVKNEQNITTDSHTEFKSQENTYAEKLKVLIVDDEEDIIDILKFFLEEMNLDVTSFKDPKLAYQSICANKYDLIITDLQMPELSGPELVKKIRTNKQIAQPKIMISTGGINIDIEDQDNELTNMVDSYLFKPFDKDKLKSSIDLCYSTIEPTKS